MIEATSNPVCNISTSASDNSDCLQNLVANARGAQTATVKCAANGIGTESVVTASAGTPFTGITSGSTVNIAGIFFTVASITDATHMVLTTTPATTVCSTASVTIYLPRTMVSVTAGSTAVTWVSGPQFTNLAVNVGLQLGFQTSMKVASITDATDLVLATGGGFITPGVTGTVPLYVTTLISSGGAGPMPLFILALHHSMNTLGATKTFYSKPRHRGIRSQAVHLFLERHVFE